MKMKKINAALGLLSIVFMLLHIGYILFSYLTFYYNPFLNKVFAVPFMVVVCLHAVCGMLTVFMQADGTRMDLYPEQNKRTILQRVSAALIFPLLIIHIKTPALIGAFAEKGQRIFVFLLMAAEVLFFAVVITHVSVSLTKGLVTLGILTSRETQKRLDRIIYVIGAAVYVILLYSVLKLQIAMFLKG